MQSDVPTVVRRFRRTSDRVWQDAADYNIGDTIPYKLTGTLPETMTRLQSTHISSTIEMSAGLTLEPASIKAIDGTEIASSKYTVTGC